MTDAVLRVRADAAQARGVLGGLTTDIKGVGDGTFFAAKAGFRYKAALATVTTAVGLAMRGQVQYGDWLDKNSQRLGVSVERLSSYSTMIKKADSNREEFARGLAAMTARMRDAQNGSAEAARTFDDLGVEFEDAEGNLRNVDDVLRDVADRFAVTEDGATKTALAGKLLGEELGVKLIPLLNGGSQAMSEMAEESRQLGIVWSKADAAAAAELKDNVEDLKATVQSFIQVAAQAWIPTFSDVAQGATLAARAIFKLDEAQARSAAATEDARGRIVAQSERISQLTNEIDILKRQALDNPDLYDSLISSIEQLKEQRESERAVLRKLNGELGEQAGLRQIEQRATELSAEAIARANRLKDEAAEASKKHAAALKTEQLALDTLRAQVETTGRSMEEMIGINLRNVQLTLQQGLEAGLITLEEFERRFTQASMTAQAQIDQIQAKSEMAKEVSIESTARATESFDSTGEAISNFSSLATTAMDGIRVASESAKKGGEDTTLAIVQLTTKVGAQIATMVGAAVTAASTTAAAQVSSNAAITASAVPAAVTQGAATYGASATTGSGASIAAIAGGIAAVLGIVGSIAGIGDSGITPELFKRVTSANHSLFVMRSGETLVTNNGTRGLERQIQLTNDVLAREAAANEASAPVNISVYADSRHMERGIRVVQNRRDERGLPRSNQKRFGR